MTIVVLAVIICSLAAMRVEAHKLTPREKQNHWERINKILLVVSLDGVRIHAYKFVSMAACRKAARFMQEPGLTLTCKKEKK